MKYSAALKIASPSERSAPLSEPPNTEGLDEGWFEEEAPSSRRSFVGRRGGPIPKLPPPRLRALSLRPEVPVEAQARRVTPKADVFVSPTVTLIVIDAPGVQGSSISLEIIEGSLRYRGTRSATEPGQPSAIHFERSFVLERRIDAAEIDATLRHGVLRVRLPHESKAPCRIAVQSRDADDDIVDLSPSDIVEL